MHFKSESLSGDMYAELMVKIPFLVSWGLLVMTAGAHIICASGSFTVGSPTSQNPASWQYQFGSKMAVLLFVSQRSIHLKNIFTYRITQIA